MTTRCRSLSQLVDEFTTATMGDGDDVADSVEAIMYDKERAVVMTGVFVDKPGRDGEINKFGR